MKKIPIIDVTDLYHPYQDPGDNFDLIMPYGLPEIDLKAIILDSTEDYRKLTTQHRNREYWEWSGLTRDPGIIPVTQLNYIFDRDVPYGLGPFTEMKEIDDKMMGIPKFQQTGIELILKTLEDSEDKVHILSFGSLRSIAVAFNRNPSVFFEKVACIHISAGSATPDYYEWNVQLDSEAYKCVLRSKLPLALYPCAYNGGPFNYGKHNTYWKLEDLSFLKDMNPKLQSYLQFAFDRENRSDFLCAMDSLPSQEAKQKLYSERWQHHVWETAIWTMVTGRKLVRNPKGTYRLTEVENINATDTIIINELLPCKVSILDDCTLSFEMTQSRTNVSIYYREDPFEIEKAYREALPELYKSFLCK